MTSLDGVVDLDRSRYTRLFSLLQPHLNERTKRLVGAAMADSVGRGGQRMVQEITRFSSHTLTRGHDPLTGVKSVSKDRIGRVWGWSLLAHAACYVPLTVLLDSSASLHLLSTRRHGGQAAIRSCNRKARNRLTHGLRDGFAPYLADVSTFWIDRQT